MRSGPSTRLASGSSLTPQQPPFLPAFLKTPPAPPPQTQVFPEAPDFPGTPNSFETPKPLPEPSAPPGFPLCVSRAALSSSSCPPPPPPWWCDLSPLHLQIQNNWSYGENIDEELKTHPMLRPYKTFSEKVSKSQGPVLRVQNETSKFERSERSEAASSAWI